MQKQETGVKSLWEYLGSEKVYKDRILGLRHDKYHFTTNDITRDFSILEFGDWVNIIPITPEGKIVMIHQYRHGVRRVTLEIPGGMMGPDDIKPEDAAIREMLEETGYYSEDVTHIGTVEPNPAIQTNKCHTYLAKGAYLKSKQNLDPTEAIRIELLEKQRIYDMIRNGDITHALVIAAFAHLLIHETGGKHI